MGHDGHNPFRIRSFCKASIATDNWVIGWVSSWRGSATLAMGKTVRFFSKCTWPGKSYNDGWLIDWLVDWLIHSLIGWLIGWLFDWMIWSISFVLSDLFCFDWLDSVCLFACLLVCVFVCLFVCLFHWLVGLIGFIYLFVLSDCLIVWLIWFDWLRFWDFEIRFES